MSQLDEQLPVRFETPRLILRCYAKDDAAWYYRMSLRNRDHLRRYESGNVVMSLTSEPHAQKTLGELATYWKEGTCFFVGAFDKQSEEFVAQIYVGPFNREPVEFIVGYMADCAHEGRGYVTEAVVATVAKIFDRLGATRVRIHCDESNERSRRVAERCGFHQESFFLEDRKGSDGELHQTTTVVYLRLRSGRVSN